MASTIEDIRQLKMSAADLEQEAAILQNLSTNSIEDPDFHLEVARWAEEVGEPQIALREWSLALRDRPKDPTIASHLAEAYLDAGRLDKAVRCLKIVVEADPSDIKAWEALVEAQRQLGRLEESSQSAQIASHRTGDRRFDKKPVLDEEPAYEDEAFLVLFQDRFQGREGVYARQWVDPKGLTGYNPIREPFSVQAVKNHLQGNHTVGIYPLRMDNTVFFAAFDLDLSSAVVRANAPGSSGWREAYEDLEGYADLLEGKAHEMGLTLHRADSGFKGTHLWAFFAEPIPAKLARQMCKTIAHGISVPANVRTEIFPKQNALPVDGLGNLIKIPLGVHRKTGRRAWFRGAAPEMKAQREYLKNARLIHREKLQLSQEIVSNQELNHHLDQVETDRQELALVPQPEPEVYLPDADDELQRLLGRCVTLRVLDAKVSQTGQLTHDEIKVLTHTIGHLATGPQAVNHLLSRCLETDPSLFLKSPLRGNPMGCSKIRARIPEITSTVACDCRFHHRGGLYPTPVLHLSQPAQGMPLEQIQFQALMSDFLRAKKEVYRWTRVMESYADKLDLWFTELGIDEVDTSYGALKRKRDETTGRVHFELIV